jgi:hypothetical protein
MIRSYFGQTVSNLITLDSNITPACDINQKDSHISETQLLKLKLDEMFLVVNSCNKQLKFLNNKKENESKIIVDKESQCNLDVISITTETFTSKLQSDLLDITQDRNRWSTNKPLLLPLLKLYTF